MFIHLLTPNGLPWTRNGVPRNDREHDFLKNMKRSKTAEELCNGLPGEFEEFLRYCRRLKFAEAPDYRHWIKQFKELALDMGFPASADLVWPVSTDCGGSHDSGINRDIAPRNEASPCAP